MKKKSMPKQQQETQVKTKISVGVKISIAVMMLAGISLTAGMILTLFEKPQDKVVITEESSFTVTLQAGDYSISEPDERGYRKIIMDDFDNISEPGEPALPTKIFLVLMPPGAEFSSFEIVKQEPELIPGEFLIKEAPTPQPITDPDVSAELDYELAEIIPPKEAIYQSDDLYPAQTVIQRNEGQMRKYKFQEIKFNPIQYQPLANKLTFTGKITVKINYKQVAQLSESVLADQVLDQDIKNIFINYNQFQDQYQLRDKNFARESGYDYVIIAPLTIADSEGMATLVDYRQNQGFTVKVETTELIDSSYSGEDLPEKIRNYLQENYINWGLQYVALVGTHAVIPMRFCSAELPNDFYYSELTSVWAEDYRYCGDHDWYPEVYVGRIPLDEVAQFNDYVNRVIIFESDGNSYKKKVLLAVGIWGVPEDADQSAEYLYNSVFTPNGYEVTRLYEESGECPSIYNHDGDVSRDDIVSQWQDNHYAIAFLAAHGNPVRFSSELCPETWDTIFIRDDIQLLDSEYPSVVIGNACSTSNPMDNNNLGCSFIRHNAVSYLGYVEISYTLYKAISKYYFDNLVMQGLRNAPALALAKLSLSEKEILISSLYGEPMIKAANVIHVPDDFSTIQEAIDYAQPGDRVFVHEGEYHENITMKYRVDLVSESPSDTVIIGDGNDDVIIFDPGVTGQTFDQIIRGFTIKNSSVGKAGIRCLNSASPHIRNNIIYGNGTGIYCTGDSPEIINNTVADNSQQGIHLDGSSLAGIKNNNITDNSQYGIYVVNSSPGITYNNVFANNGDYYGIEPGLGDISFDPVFRDPGAGNYNLSPHSPSVDQGDPQDDYYLEPQPNGSRINMGAYGNTAEAAVLNHMPILDSIGDKTAIVTDELVIQISAQDQDDDLLAYETSTLPVGAVFDNENHIFNWTPNPDQLGNYNITFTVTDNYGAFSSEEIEITVMTYTITNKVNAAPDGTTVYIKPGIYNENILIFDRNLHLIGSGAGNTIINGFVSIAFTLNHCIDGYFTFQGFSVSSNLTESIGAFSTCEVKPHVDIINNVVNGAEPSSAAILVVKMSANIINNTIVGSPSDGILFNNNSVGEIKNNIIMNNLVGINVRNSSPVISFNNVYNNENNYWQCVPGIGDMSVDPIFQDPASGDYHLQHISPNIDKGDPNDDYSLEPQPNGDRINMGAYGNTIEAAYYYICGDVDYSGNIDIDDIVYLVSYIFSGGPAPDPMEIGDVDASGNVDIDDVIYIVEYIFAGGPEPDCGPQAAKASDPTKGWTLEEINQYIEDIK